MTEEEFVHHLLCDRYLGYTYSLGLCLDLKIPLLLMTATFNNSLLVLLEKMIGVKVLANNFLWNGRVKIVRRQIRVNVSMSIQYTRNVKKVLESTLSDNFE